MGRCFAATRRAPGGGRCFRRFQRGERVRHAKFGIGEVVEAQDGKVVVRFGSEERIFVPELAPLSKA